MGSRWISLHGVLEHITFYNPRTHYTVARLNITTPAVRVIVTGMLPGAAAGSTVKLDGKWIEHPKYGRQFQFRDAEILLPDTEAGMRDYLASGIIKGIGPSLADKIVRRFGADALRIMEDEPALLTAVDGIGPETAERIHAGWTHHAVVRQIMAFLREHGIPPAHGPKIFSIYGADALMILRNEPYRLADDISGNGFYMADRIARNLGLADGNTERVAACIRHLIHGAAGQGHSYMDGDDLLDQAERLFEIDREAVFHALDGLCEAGDTVVETDMESPASRKIFPAWLHAAETGVAGRLRAMQTLPLRHPSTPAAKRIDEIEHRLVLRLSIEQRRILEAIWHQRAAIISGGPGTGKTTAIRAIAEMFHLSGSRICLAAPTGRSARRMTEITGFEAHTIHKLLEYNLEHQRFGRDMDNPIDADVLIVDEASMIDTMLMHHLLAAVPLPTRLILVGDADQLPSIGPGNLLGDLIVSNTIPVYFLKTVFRQDAESQIIANAHRVLNGETPIMATFQEAMEQDADFIFIEQNDPAGIADIIVDLCQRSLPTQFISDPLHAIQVLTPMHKGPAGTIALNQALQHALNPGAAVISGSSHAVAFKIGDKVMHLKNNYKKEVFNGDMGVIRAWDPATETLTVAYEGRLVEYGPDEIDELTLGYAISVHKSQGSEYPVVILPLITHHYIMLQRNLLYTAVTRAQKLVILIGTPKALELALTNNLPRLRRSGLARRLSRD
jgi:exodeoxyribonuclease V alpha subunit